MSTLRFSWKGVTAVVLCSIVVATTDRLFAQVSMWENYRTAAPLSGEEGDAWMDSVPQSAGSNPSSSPYVIYDDNAWAAQRYPQGNSSEPSSVTNTTTNLDVRDGVPQSSPILEQPAQHTRPYEPDGIGGSVESDNTLPGMPQTFYGEGDTFLRQHTGFGKPSVCEWMAAKPMEDEKKKNELRRSGCDPAEWMKGVSDNPSDMPSSPIAPPPKFQGMPPAWNEDTMVPPTYTTTPVQPFDDAEAPYPAASQPLPVDSEEIVNELATQLGDTRRENEELRTQNEQWMQELEGLQRLVRQLQDTIAFLSSSSQPLHGAAEEVPADRAMMRGEDAQDAAAWPVASGTEAGMSAEPISTEPEQGIFGKVLDWFGL